MPADISYVNLAMQMLLMKINCNLIYTFFSKYGGSHMTTISQSELVPLSLLNVSIIYVLILLPVNHSLHLMNCVQTMVFIPLSQYT